MRHEGPGREPGQGLGQEPGLEQETKQEAGTI